MPRQKQTLCSQGHELSGDNLYVSPDGSRRYCRACQKERNRKYNRTTRGLVPRGRRPRGEEVYLAKLTEEAVEDIRTSPATNYALAADYGVSRRAIQFVRSGRNWKHV